MANKKSVVKLNGYFSEKPNKYPTIDENTTLMARPALVISLKSKNKDFGVMVFVSKSDNLIECKDSKKLCILCAEFYFFYLPSPAEFKIM